MQFKVEIVVRGQLVTKEAPSLEGAQALADDAFKDGAADSAEIRDSNGRLAAKYLRSFSMG
jgi:hypothetical protein